jgi:hypothetical protein
VNAFGHDVFLQVGELACESRVYFAKFPSLPRNVLGRQRWLRNLRMAVIDYDSLLYLSAYDTERAFLSAGTNTHQNTQVSEEFHRRCG